ncbi:rhodanese-like domain-containing protein [Lactococcus insecticola]|uniref:Rhodanese domain-containing protein n=1 Tax=Pseudolactococcus insecticola TaxID=2709158 RepID=A0A6A0B508_9LACT|nr:rhodanese-like domain-containing protein [Lactococcus insecticola]GFH40292.1 hypothetical protein Hs20B_06900 [Lactococcus insecticola]
MFIYIFDVILIIAIVAIVGYPQVNKLRIKKISKTVDNAEFSNAVTGGQLIDLREPADFRVAHILGARNLPYSQFEQSISAIRKDKPVLFYENGKPTISVRAALKLKKAGYTDIYILKSGMKAWNGKTKTV